MHSCPPLQLLAYLIAYYDNNYVVIVNNYFLFLAPKILKSQFFLTTDLSVFVEYSQFIQNLFLKFNKFKQLC